MEPYYTDEFVTIYQATCEDLLCKIGQFDLLLTDPPYGLDEANGRNKKRGKLAVPVDYGTSDWDETINQNAIDLARNICTYQIIFGGNYYVLPPSKCWLIWDKENGETDFADCELAWTNFDKATRLKRHIWNGMIRKNHEQRWHPTQKPLDVIKWSISQSPNTVTTILDPFMGSGTTLRAAKDLGIKAVGIEIDERYCEIAANRMSQLAMAL